MTINTKNKSKSKNDIPINGKEFEFSVEEVNLNIHSKYIKNYRENAYNIYQTTPIPDNNDEAWRRTSLRKFNPQIFSLPQTHKDTNENDLPKGIVSLFNSDQTKSQIIINSWGTQIHQQNQESKNGVIFTSLEDALENRPNIVENILGKNVKAEDGKFAALTGAFARNGLLLYIPEGYAADEPFQSIGWAQDDGTAHLDHILVYLADGAEATYIHQAYSSETENGELLHSGIVEIYVGKNAKLHFVEIQSWGKNVWNFTHENVRVDQNGEIDWIVCSLGSLLTKSFYDINLFGEGAVGRLYGLSLLDDHQHLDHDTQQNHLAPHTTSDLLFKGVMLNESYSVWQGMIYVAENAKKADGYQANRNLILSNDARADSIPGLEILNDDVRCTHGATIGRIDPEQIFYLCSRGISNVQAKRLIVEGFLTQIIERIPSGDLHNYLYKQIRNKIIIQ